MRTYKLVLTDHDGNVLESWVIGDAANESADIVYPIRKLGPQSLADDINQAIQITEDGRKRGRK
jgi:hypothetical protein